MSKNKLENSLLEICAVSRFNQFFSARGLMAVKARMVLVWRAGFFERKKDENNLVIFRWDDSNRRHMDGTVVALCRRWDSGMRHYLQSNKTECGVQSSPNRRTEKRERRK